MTPRSRNGKTTCTPGPRAPTQRPRRNTTMRWYSGTILTPAMTNTTTTSRRIQVATGLASRGPSPRGGTERLVRGAHIRFAIAVTRRFDQ
jgi:hypothetical protein